MDTENGRVYPTLDGRYCLECGNLLEDSDKNTCKFCRGYTKIPLGPEARPYEIFRWVKQ